ncbi:MAG: ATP-binding cassette domain-containing protein [Telmatospirillum sp.]|nr:ATP-binding cassette domain-containing protein [Telmatospirillum sp.]
MSGLVFEHVRLAAGARVLVADFSLALAPGEIATVMGASGSGKSSLLAYACGTLAPGLAASGSVRLDGIEISGLPPERRRIGILFQDDLLFPHLSVGANLGFGLRADVKDRRARIDQALEAAGLAGFAARDPATLSGGQRQRVALMRALLAEPAAILLDEPFGKLDADLRAQMRDFVFAHVRERKLPCLMVTHDSQDAAAAGGVVRTL